MKKYFIILPLLVALAFRLYPTILTSLPFSTDAWSPIRNTELLLQYTPIDLENSIMDGYNCYWPANSIFGAILSQVLGLKPIFAMAVGVPLAGALTILIFYTLVTRITKNHVVAFLSSLLLATIYPYAFFMAGVTKETFANPLYILSIQTLTVQGRWKKILLFTIASSALVTAHHLTTFVAIAILSTIILGEQIIMVKEGRSIDKLSLLPIPILLTITTIYFCFYAYRGLKLTITLSDLLSVVSYQIIAFTITVYLASKHQATSPTRTILTSSMALALTLSLTLLCTKRPIISGAPILPSHYIFYAIPFILASPLIVLGYGELKRMGSEHHLIPLLWLSATIGIGGYAVFGNSPIGHTLAYRSLNFICIPLTVLCALGLYRLYKTDKFNVKWLAKSTAIITFILLIALNSYNIYAAVSLQERYMGYFWLYRNQEYLGLSWTTSFSINTVSGDVKTSYLLKDYFNVPVNVLPSLQYLMGKGSAPKILFTYKGMLDNGYVLYGGYSINLPEGWSKKLNNLSLVYLNGLANVYARN